jgi:hypothetical protein
MDGPLNSDCITECIHWACASCWENIYENGNGNTYKCPFCREDISEWLIGHYGRCEHCCECGNDLSDSESDYTDEEDSQNYYHESFNNRRLANDVILSSNINLWYEYNMNYIRNHNIEDRGEHGNFYDSFRYYEDPEDPNYVARNPLEHDDE